MSELKYDELKNMKAFSHLPILTLDERWYRLIPDNIKTDEIKYWEKQVNNLLKKRGQINSDITDVSDLKNKLINAIVLHMEDDSNDSKYRKLMNENQRLIIEAKDKISDLKKQAENIPEKLELANQRLMIETVRLCYHRMNENTEDIKVLDKWINATRIKMKKNLLIKQDKEISNEQMYSYMHDMLGFDAMSELDRKNES